MSAPNGELPKNIQCLLYAAQAKACFLVGDYGIAEQYYLDALKLGSVSAEPLIRLYLLLSRVEEAREFYRIHSQSLEPEARRLVGVLLENEVLVDETLPLGPLPNQEASDNDHPENLLYRGLTLRRLNHTTEAASLLREFAIRGDWGREAAESTVFDEKSPLCQACKREASQHWHASITICSDCDDLLRDPAWIGQALWAPSTKQKDFLHRVYGDDCFVGLTSLGVPPEELGEVAEPIHAQDLASLVSVFNLELRELYSRAESPTVESLGLAVSESRGGNELFEYPGSQLEFRQALSQRDQGLDDLEWVMNIAHWCHKLTPSFCDNGVSTGDFLQALRFHLGLAGIREYGIALMMCHKMADAQSEIFEELLMEHPEALFLHSVLAQPRPQDFSDSARQRRLSHQTWLIKNRPTAFREHWLPGMDDKASLELVQAWSGWIRGNPDDAQGLASAANFFSVQEPVLAEELLYYCHCLELD